MITAADRWRRAGVVGTLVLVLAACSGDADPTSATTTTRATNPKPATTAMPTVDTTLPPTTQLVATTIAPQPAVTGLDGLLVGPDDVPFVATVVATPAPTTVCRAAVATPAMDSRGQSLTDPTGAIAVSTLVEVYASPEVAARAWAERTDIVSRCDWSLELPGQTRPTQTEGRLTDSPGLVAGLPECAGAVTAGAVRITTDNQPVTERREVVMAIAICRDMMTSVRIDLLDQLPVDQLAWIGPLVMTQLSRVAAAA
ncbi:MAG: hypothetical protein ACK5OX_17065 [Desertimonas sp.]